MVVETTNVTLANTNRKTILERKAHATLIQRHCLTPAQSEFSKNEATKKDKQFEGGALDPEHGRVSAGVGVLGVEGVIFNSMPKPIKDQQDVVVTGRCAMHCMGMGGTTLTIAVIYGWTGAKKESLDAARPDDIRTIIQMQFEGVAARTKNDCRRLE